MKCKAKGCIRKIRYKTTAGLCRSHYARLKKHGDVYVEIPIGLRGITLPIQRKILQAKPGYSYCQYCNKYKKAKEFTSSNNTTICKYCERNIGLMEVYGIDNKDYAKLLKKQKGRCALCGTKNPGGRFNVLQVDHNHQTNKIRGLLCNKCNLGLGMLEANRVPIACLMKYLKK